jgi:DNA mismatch repair protein MutS
MNETAFILRTATEKSLIIMDEVGRGTSTNDGLSIAWAVTEYLVKRVKAKTLFATHYHELTLLKLKGIQNLSLEVVENKGEIIFMKKIQEGPAASSYGIHVAQLAGLPDEVIREARRILEELVSREGEVKHALLQKGGIAAPQDKAVEQGSLFTPGELLEKEILGLDLNSTTPLEALNLLSRWQKELLFRR